MTNDEIRTPAVSIFESMTNVQMTNDETNTAGTPGLRYSEAPGRSRTEPGSLEYLRTVGWAYSPTLCCAGASGSGGRVRPPYAIRPGVCRVFVSSFEFRHSNLNAMAFLNPILLFGMTAIAAPILIHLLNRRTVGWAYSPTLRFDGAEGSGGRVRPPYAIRPGVRRAFVSSFEFRHSSFIRHSNFVIRI